MAEPQLLCRQAHAAGLAASRNGSKLLITIQGDGVLSYDLSRLAPGDTKALGSSQAQLLAPVQQLGGNYIAAVQPHGSAAGRLLCSPAAAKQPRPLLDAEQQLPLPSELHSLHVLHSSASGDSQRRESGCVAVVLADGTVGAADFDTLQIRQCQGSSNSPSSGGSHHSRAGSKKQQQQKPPAVLAAASDGRLLAVAHEGSVAGADVCIDVFAAAGSSSSPDNISDGQASAAPGLLLTHTCVVARPAGSSGSKLSSVVVSPGAVVLVWEGGCVSVHHADLSQRSSQPEHVALLQLPESVTAAAAAEEDLSHEARPAAGRKRRATEAAAGGAAASHKLLCAAVSDSHLLAVGLQHGSNAAAAAGSGGSAHYAILDTRYGCCLLSGPLELDLPAAPTSSSAVQLLAMPQQGAASAALLAGGSVFLLQLQLPKADLAGLVACLALGNSNTAGSGSGAKPQLVTARQQLDLLSLAAAMGPAGVCALAAVPAGAGAAPTAVAAGGRDPDAAAAAVEAAAEQLWAALSKQPVPAGELQQAAQQLCDALQQQQPQLNPQLQQQQHPSGAKQPGGRRGRQQQQQQQQQQDDAAATPQQQPGHGASALLSQRLLARGLEALAEAQEWFLVGQLHQLQPLQSLLLCPGLLPALAAAQQYSLLRQVLLAAQDIPAEALVAAMQDVLLQPADSAPRLEAAASIRAAAEAAVAAAEAAAGDASPAGAEAAAAALAAARAAAAAVDGFGTGELLLHVLLAVSVDGVEAQAALRHLPTPAVLRLLRYLNKWVRKYRCQASLRDATSASSQAPSSRPDGLLLVPSWGAVLEWCRLLLDAQLTRLAMLPAAAPMLQQLQQQLKREAGVSSRLVMLKGVADHLAMGAALPVAAEAASSEYNLELLDLRLAAR